MNTKSSARSDLSPGIRQELERTRPVTPQMLDGLAAANRRLEADPEFQADYLKAIFVEKMLQALEERGESKALVADRLGKSRQYMQKLFNEDKRVNFTIETLCAVANALGQRVHLHVCKADEEPMILTAIKTRVISSMAHWSPPAMRLSEPVWMIPSNFTTTPAISTKEEFYARADAA